MSCSSCPLPVSFSDSLCSQLFAVATLLNKLRFEFFDLLVEQIIGLMNQANECVSSYVRLFLLKPFGVKRTAFLIRQIRQIRLIRPIMFKLTRHMPNRQGLRVIGGPLTEVTVAKIVLVVQKEFFQA